MDISSVINNVSRTAAVSSVAAPSQARSIDSTAGASATDSVELSDTARLYANLPDQPIRADKVAEIRQQLADGSYLHPDKLDAAVEGLFRDLNLLA
jgi:negative regulator of flagellin synthesis FlgM